MLMFEDKYDWEDEDEPVLDSYDYYAELQAEVERDKDGDRWREALRH